MKTAARSSLILLTALHADTAAARQPLIAEAVPDRVERLHLADGECRDYNEPHFVAERIADRLDANKILYILPCYSGAYNAIYRVYVHDKRYPDETKPEFFAAYTDALGWYGKDSLINVHYDPRAKTLTAFEKSRGLGDCGARPVWRWIGDFWRLVEYRYWSQCDGSRLADDWPVIYRHPEEKAR